LLRAWPDPGIHLTVIRTRYKWGQISDKLKRPGSDNDNFSSTAGDALRDLSPLSAGAASGSQERVAHLALISPFQFHSKKTAGKIPPFCISEDGAN
jgi:hypothetical protein